MSAIELSTVRRHFDRAAAGFHTASVLHKRVGTELVERLSLVDLSPRHILVLTQDGQVARQLISPNSVIEKEYVVRLTERVPTAALVQMQGELTLDGHLLKPAHITQTDDRTLRLVLQEGRKRQIRRMCDLVELRVHSLVRVRIGRVGLGDLSRGRWRYLDTGEVF